MSFATYTVDDAVAVITLNRPERLNAISQRLLDDLHTALETAEAEQAVRAIVLTGAGRAFCAGDDLKEFAEQAATEQSIAETCAMLQLITKDIMLGSKPVIGAVAGFAVGGGFEWLLNCDLVVASDDLTCFFPEMGPGHFVTGGVTHLLPQAVGHQRAMEMLLLGERFGAAALRDMGLVNRVVARAEMMPVAMTLAREIATRAPHAVSQLKRVLTSEARLTLEQSFDAEEAAARACFAHPDTKARIASRIKTR